MSIDSKTNPASAPNLCCVYWYFLRPRCAKGVGIDVSAFQVDDLHSYFDHQDIPCFGLRASVLRSGGWGNPSRRR
jgi:hypothetical protein